MNREHDAFIHVIETWLDLEVDREDPELVLDRVVDRLEATPQRRASWLAWRIATMSSTTMRLGLAAAILVAAVAVGVSFLARQAGEPVSTPSPSAQPLAGTTVLSPGTYFVHEQFPMRITFSVPSEGWQNYVWEGGAAAANTRALCSGGPDCDPPDGGGVGFHIVTGVPAEPCNQGSPRMDIGQTIQELADAVANRPGWVASQPTPTEVGGFAALALDLRAEPSEIEGCTGSVSAYFAGSFARGATQGEHLRLWIVDVDGTRLVIEAFDFPGTPEEDVETATRIVESVEFAPQ